MRLVANDTAPEPLSRESQIARFGVFASEERDLPKLLDRAVATAAAGLDLDLCAILKPSAGRDSLNIVASVGWHARAAQRAIVAAGVRSQEGYTLSSRNSVVSRDLARETRFRPASLVFSQGLVSGISVVIEGETGPFGVLVGHTKSECPFSKDDLDFMQSIAHILTESIRRMHADRDRARLSAIVESASEAIIGTTLDGTIFSWNRAAEEIYGYSKTDVLGSKVAMLFPPGGAPRTGDAQSVGAEGLGPYETVCQRRDGASIDVEIRISPIRLPNGRIAGESMIVHDVTERARQERALRVHTGILGQIQIGVVICCLESLDDAASLRLTLANPAGADALGISLETALGRRFVEVCPEGAHSEYLARYAEVARTGRGHDFGECTIADSRSTPRVFSIHAFPLPDQSVGVVFHNITAQRQLADQLRQAQRMEVIGQLTGGVAHDFNNLLTVISGYAGMLEDEIGRDTALGEDLLQIRHATDSASALTRQLLTFSRQQSCRPTLVDLPTVIDRSRGMLRRLIGEDVQLVVTHGIGEVIVRADAGQIEQVVMNLAVNARDAMPEGGRLIIETNVVGLTAEQARRLGNAVPQGYASLTVADTGSGMDASTRERMFEPFFTTKDAGRGTGLGLATVHGIVKQHGGHIEVESEPGQGTVFKIYLPLALQKPMETSMPERHDQGSTGSETILVVEDEESVRVLLGGLLSQAGYSVLAAASPREAITIAGQRARSIDLLLTDIVMPQQTGPDLANLLAATHPSLRVLYMSGYSRDLIARRGVLALKEPFIAKPFTPRDLLSAVRQALEGAPPSALEHEGMTIQ